MGKVVEEYTYPDTTPAPTTLTDKGAGYGVPFTPVTVREPHTGITHTANDHVDSNNFTLCGLDASKWTSFSETAPICPICADKLEQLTTKK